MLAENIIKGEAPPHRGVGDLQVGGESALVDKGGAEPRTEGHEEFETATGDDAGGGNLSIVEDECGDAELLFESRGHVKVFPLINQGRHGLCPRPGPADVVGCVNDDPVTDHAGHAEGDPVCVRQLFSHLLNKGDELGRGQRVGNRLTQSGCDLEGSGIKDSCFDSSAAAVDTEGQWPLVRILFHRNDASTPFLESMCQTVAMTRIRLDLSYEGTHFHGWAAQPGLRTVEGVLTAALETVLRRPIKLTVAGRTDAGVHASAQIAHFDIDEESWDSVRGRSDRQPEDALITRLTGVLSRDQGVRGVGDIVVKRASIVSPEFDARFSAAGRHYRYRIDDRPVPDVFMRMRALRALPLDERKMSEGGAALLGEHDFLSYCKPREGATTIRTLRRIDIQRPQIGPDAGLLIVDLEADAFCHSMVRSIVGTLIEVGRAKQDVMWPQVRLRERRRDTGVIIAPAYGLTLERVEYPDEDRYGEQAVKTRRVREKPLTDGLARIDPVP